MKYPNKNSESFQSVLRSLIKDILELDAGVLVKVFTVDSYDFDHLEPKSGAPLLKPFGQRKMVELYSRDGASFLKETDKFGFVRGYWQYSYQIPAHPMYFNRDEIVYVMENPRSMSTYGFARTQAILDIVKSLQYSTLYNKKFFEEVPLPEGIISLLDTSEPEMKTLMDWWNREFKAQPHKLGIVNKDIKWQSFTIPNQELQFLETQKQYFQFVISMFGLTPTEMGLTEDVNRSTSASQVELTKRKGIRPMMGLIEKYINGEIIPEFGFEGIEFTFVYDDPAEKLQRLENYAKELEMGIATINEVRTELGKEPIVGGDVSSYVNIGMGIGSGAMQEQDTSEPEEQEEGTGENERENAEGVENKTEKPKTKKGIYDGQYYNVPSEVIRPHHGEIIQPQANQMLDPVTNDTRSINESIGATSEENTIPCPNCGSNTLTQMNSADDIGNEIRFRCTNCAAVLTQEEIDNMVLDGITNTMMGNTSEKPISIPNWSPKSFQGLETIKGWTGYDVEKQGISKYASEYINSKEYIKLIERYWKGDIGKENRDKLRKILDQAIKENWSIKKIREKIRKELKLDKQRSESIARTETVRITSRANEQQLTDKGHNRVIWLTARDERRCEQCMKRHGKKYNLSTVKGDIPLHPLCRCMLSAVGIE